MWLKAPNISNIHGFSTRHGGVSSSPFDTMNLGGSDDLPENVQRNRLLALENLGLETKPLYTLKQVHGDKVCVAVSTSQEGDALVSNQAGDVIGVLVADCYPVLFSDEKNRVIGAAHCGWRGTVAGLAGKTVLKMLSLGAELSKIKAAIGQGISPQNFEVGDEVIQRFRESQFPESCWDKNKIDLVKCIELNLLSAGVASHNIWAMNRCSFEADFFSHRRDKGKTGRMMGLIALS